MEGLYDVEQRQMGRYEATSVQEMGRMLSLEGGRHLVQSQVFDTESLVVLIVISQGS